MVTSAGQFKVSVKEPLLKAEMVLARKLVKRREKEEPGTISFKFQRSEIISVS